MNWKMIFVDAILAFIIAFGGSLITLLADGTDLKNISMTAVVAAFLMALVNVAKMIQSRIADGAVAKPANMNNQAGFAKISVLVLLAVVSAIMIGCATPSTPRQALLQSYEVTDSVVEAIIIAKKDGMIDDEKRDELLEKVKEARSILNLTREMLASQNCEIEGKCNEFQINQNLDNVQLLIDSIQNSLRKGV